MPSHRRLAYTISKSYLYLSYIIVQLYESCKKHTKLLWWFCDPVLGSAVQHRHGARPPMAHKDDRGMENFSHEGGLRELWMFTLERGCSGGSHPYVSTSDRSQWQRRHSPQWCPVVGQEAMDPNIQEASSAFKKKLSYCEGGQTLGQDAQSCCGVCVHR